MISLENKGNIVKMLSCTSSPLSTAFLSIYIEPSHTQTVKPKQPTKPKKDTRADICFLSNRNQSPGVLTMAVEIQAGSQVFVDRSSGVLMDKRQLLFSHGIITGRAVQCSESSEEFKLVFVSVS